MRMFILRIRRKTRDSDNDFKEIEKFFRYFIQNIGVQIYEFGAGIFGRAVIVEDQVRTVDTLQS